MGRVEQPAAKHAGRRHSRRFIEAGIGPVRGLYNTGFKRETPMSLRHILLCIALATPFASPAATLRWASQGDVVTQDPHAQDEGFTKSIQWMVYERLTQPGKDMAVRPWLATGWKIVSPTQRLVYLRHGVKFTDGTE